MGPALTFYSADASRLRAFYAAAGLDLTPERHGDGPIHHCVVLGGVALEVLQAEDSGLGGLGLVLGLPVEDLDGICERLRRLGAEEIRPTAAVQGVRRAVYRDPDGHAVYLFEPLPVAG